jgi:SAM-dependent methyltransferase
LGGKLIIQKLYLKSGLFGIKTTRSFLKKYATKSSKVLDLGCGRWSLIIDLDLDLKYVGVEAFKPYADAIESKQIVNTKNSKKDISIINKYFEELKFADGEFDLVLLIDVVEHLEKSKGLELIEKAKKWTSNYLIVSTPNGFVAQDALDENELQIHVSGWEVEELKKLGFDVRGLSGWKLLRKDYHSKVWTEDLTLSLKFKPKKFWFGVAAATQLITYYFPRLAFQIIGVYQKEK